MFGSPLADVFGAPAWRRTRYTTPGGRSAFLTQMSRTNRIVCGVRPFMRPRYEHDIGPPRRAVTP
jgi:hypothetical protein